MKRKNVNLPPNLIYNDFAQFASTHTHTQSLFSWRFFFTLLVTFYIYFFSCCRSSVPFFGWNLSIFLFYRYIKSTHSLVVFFYGTAKYFVSLIQETLCFFFLVLAAFIYFSIFLFLFLFSCNKNAFTVSQKKLLVKIALKTSLYIFFVVFRNNFVSINSINLVVDKSCVVADLLLFLFSIIFFN